MTTIVRVAVPTAAQGYFDYALPEGMGAQPGMRVQVPFGSRRLVGVVMERRTDTPVAPAALKTVEALLDTAPLLPPDVLALLDWAQRYYHYPPGEVVSAALPVLLRAGHPAQRPLTRWIQVTPEGHAALSQKKALARAFRQRQLLELLAQNPDGMMDTRVRQAFPDNAATLRALHCKGWLTVTERLSEVPTTHPSRLHSVESSSAMPPLNADQQQAVQTVAAQLDRFQVFLLEGVTGSGKTEVYLRLVAHILSQSRQALVLVPEISLTPQLVARFAERFTVPIAVLHSGLADRERLDAWLMAQTGVAGVVIGTRSAVFTPLPRLGIIIIDEEHDLSLKQQEGFRYHARDVAILRAREARIPIVLGSATPSLETLHNAQRGRYHHLRLPQRVGQARTPVMRLIDLRHHKADGGLSVMLLSALHAHLEAGNQVLLFRNRRGFAPTWLCTACGWISQCDRCDARMTVHWRHHRLICHHCGAQRPLDSHCPQCQSPALQPLGYGTERLEDLLTQHFPGVGIVRIDQDSTRRKGSLQALLASAHRGEKRILIGTQMLAKGHHLPDVTLVGVIDVDQGLFSADFRASERMAQLIIQVAGRAGRADKAGEVLIQTRYPDHPLLHILLTAGYNAFAQAALKERKNAHLPPFTCHALLRAEAPDADAPLQFLEAARAAGEQFLKEQPLRPPPSAQNGGAKVDLLGPVTATMERREGHYRAQLLVQAPRRNDLQAFLESWMGMVKKLTLARKVRWSLDVDPQELL